MKQDRAIGMSAARPRFLLLVLAPRWLLCADSLAALAALRRRTSDGAKKRTKIQTRYIWPFERDQTDGAQGTRTVAALAAFKS
jgi:hypothetical protein